MSDTEQKVDKPVRFYLIAGEASGDLHAANLILQLKKQHPNSSFRAWGGDRMEAAGAEVVKHYRELAFMGFVEVITNLRTILKNIARCKKDIATHQPDALILIDYPGFNMRIGPYAKSLGIPVYYYISPQIWAWKQNRVHKLKQFVHRMFVILPFEKDFYAKFDMDVDFVGHPLLDAIAEFNRTPLNEEELFENWGVDPEKRLVALLPGSRKQEVKVMLQVMLKAAARRDDLQLVVAAAPSLEPDFYREVLRGTDVQVVYGQTYSLLRMAHAAMVTSGTATLETALFDVPQVVCYKGNYMSYLIARQLVKIKYISLVNLIMDREVVRELIQKDMNPKTLGKELGRISDDVNYREKMKSDYSELRQVLGGEGASAVTADLLLKTL